MKLKHLKVENFGSIREVEVAFGPGLNVLYGPNDLGKSTLADAIRLAFLLPHTSSHGDVYVPWVGARSPMVELTFEMGPADVWRVRKEFGKSGSSLLHWSKNGTDFEQMEKARGVDKRLRELLCWGIPEPGGQGASKGLPSSFLATVLLSTQSDVAGILKANLGMDPSQSGKERISAALQAIAQDPTFLAILRQTQARRDEAFTATGARSTRKDSKLSQISARVNERRKELEALTKRVMDSQAVELQLEGMRLDRDSRLLSYETLSREVAAFRQRAQVQNRVEAASSALAALEQQAAQVVALSSAVEQLSLARDAARTEVEAGKSRVEAAEAELLAVQEMAGADPVAAATLARQEAELRKAAAERAQGESQSRLDQAMRAISLMGAELVARGKMEAKERLVADAPAVEARLLEVTAELEQCELWRQALLLREARAAVDRAASQVEELAALTSSVEQVGLALADLRSQREALRLPGEGVIARLRKLETELAGARGALNVGLVLTLTPGRPLSVTVDGVVQSVTSPLVLEASSEISLDVEDVGTLRVVGGSASVQETARLLEARWKEEARPHLLAAGVSDLEGLERLVEESRVLEGRIADQARDLARLETEIVGCAGSAERLGLARAELAELSPVEVDLSALGADAGKTLEKRRNTAFLLRDQVQAQLQSIHLDQAALQELRSAQLARLAELEALPEFEEGPEQAVSSSQEALAEACDRKAQAERDLVALATRVSEVGGSVAAGQQRVRACKEALESARAVLAQVEREAALEEGRLASQRLSLSALDVDGARLSLARALEELAAMPVVGEDVLSRAETARLSLESLEKEIQEAQGALKQVGGNIARERMREAAEALVLMEIEEKTLEADYDAWKLLLEQMKEADAAQASNLGHALAPAIAASFSAVTQQRYQGVRLNAQLGTSGVVVGAHDRDVERISVGTREQLCTLYRLCLAEYLQSTLVLDDQLVQSDSLRMDWFRALLEEKARATQIVVLTCRPSDYVGPGHLPPEGIGHADSDEGHVRAVNLHRAFVAHP